MHCWPLRPHACCVVPDVHTSPTQQPVHVPGPHCFVVSHARVVALQSSPCGSQCTQALPPVPHVSGPAPFRHWPFSQQPVGQVFGLHPGTVRPHVLTPVSQKSKPDATQSTHWLPKLPHAAVSPPVRQTPFASQQPFGHVVVEHPPPSVFWSVATSEGTSPSKLASTLASEKSASSRLDRPHPPNRVTLAAASKNKNKRKAQRERRGT
jgi:hypothetical protein